MAVGIDDSGRDVTPFGVDPEEVGSNPLGQRQVTANGGDPASHDEQGGVFQTARSRAGPQGGILHKERRWRGERAPAFHGRAGDPLPFDLPQLPVDRR